MGSTSIIYFFHFILIFCPLLYLVESWTCVRIGVLGSVEMMQTKGDKTDARERHKIVQNDK